MLIKTIRKYKKLLFALPANFDPIKEELICDATRVLVIDEKYIEELKAEGEVMEVINKYIERIKNDK